MGRFAIALPPVPASNPHLFQLREHVGDVRGLAFAQPPRQAHVVVLMDAKPALCAGGDKVLRYAPRQFGVGADPDGSIKERSLRS